MEHPFDLSGRVALITGGNGGIGLGIAQGLAAAGASVVLAARDQEKTAAAVDGLVRAGHKAIGVSCDVTSDADRRAAVDAAHSAFGPVTILVNNSGISRRGSAHELPLEDFDAVQDTNVRAPFALSQLVYPDMVASGGGKIINIASGYSFFGGAGNPAYSTSKGALVQLTKSLANAWAKDNIQVNAIAPGFIETGLTARIAEMPDLYALLIGRIPAARPGHPKHLAGAGVFLASAASDYVTGIVLPVDGGIVISDVAVKYPL